MSVHPSMSHRLIAAWTLVAALASSFAVAQEPLRLGEALALAREQQPALEAFESAALAAREEAVAEGQLPDPKLRFGVQNYPLTGGDAFRFERDDMTMATVGLMQEVVPVRKRRLASEQMLAEAERLETEHRAADLSLRRDVTLAWLAVFAAEKRVGLLAQTAKELSAELATTRARLSSQALDTRELFLLETMLSMANDRRLIAEREAAEARAGLARWIGEAAYRPLPDDLPAQPEPPKTQPRAMDQHATLDAAVRAEEVARIEIARAQAEGRPNWEVELMYGARARDRSDMINLQFTLDPADQSREPPGPPHCRKDGLAQPRSSAH